MSRKQSQLIESCMQVLFMCLLTIGFVLLVWFLNRLANGGF